MDINWRAVQARLAALGFDPGPVDGIRGPRTDAAIRAFKRSIGFRDWPYYGPLTAAALMGGQKERETAALPWMAEAARVRGLHEARDTSQLVAWFDKSVSWINPRDIPWCGAFVATCHRAADPSINLPKNPLGARNWGGFGKACPAVFGSTLTFWRGSPSGWQGHVGFYHGEDDTHFHVLGGNQSNAVTVTRVAKSRLLTAPWPAGVEVTERRVLLSSAGVPITTNEA
ncbi:NlpC/P60 family protein [Pseudooceanicola sp.]|uniref:NlpC/P60 family protein n=1 Tax=Pseudooceanicola sp. TaxID=1914328 RepID=UPI0040580AA8